MTLIITSWIQRVSTIRRHQMSHHQPCPPYHLCAIVACPRATNTMSIRRSRVSAMPASLPSINLIRARSLINNDVFPVIISISWRTYKIRFIAPFIVPPPPPTMARSMSHQPIDPMATWDTIHRSAQYNSSPEKLSHLFHVPSDDLIMKGLSGLTIQEAAKPISPIYQKTWPKDVNQVNTGCNFDSGKFFYYWDYNWCYFVETNRLPQSKLITIFQRSILVIVLTGRFQSKRIDPNKRFK